MSDTVNLSESGSKSNDGESEYDSGVNLDLARDWWQILHHVDLAFLLKNPIIKCQKSKFSPCLKWLNAHQKRTRL